MLKSRLYYNLSRGSFALVVVAGAALVVSLAAAPAFAIPAGVALAAFAGGGFYFEKLEIKTQAAELKAHAVAPVPVEAIEAPFTDVVGTADAV